MGFTLGDGVGDRDGALLGLDDGELDAAADGDSELDLAVGVNDGATVTAVGGSVKQSIIKSNKPNVFGSPDIQTNHQITFKFADSAKSKIV